jgi:hypothetical protein
MEIWIGFLRFVLVGMCSNFVVMVGCIFPLGMWVDIEQLHETINLNFVELSSNSFIMNEISVFDFWTSLDIIGNCHWIGFFITSFLFFLYIFFVTAFCFYFITISFFFIFVLFILIFFLLLLIFSL